MRSTSPWVSNGDPGVLHQRGEVFDRTFGHLPEAPYQLGDGGGVVAVGVGIESRQFAGGIQIGGLEQAPQMHDPDVEFSHYPMDFRRWHISFLAPHRMHADRGPVDRIGLSEECARHPKQRGGGVQQRIRRRLQTGFDPGEFDIRHAETYSGLALLEKWSGANPAAAR